VEKRVNGSSSHAAVGYARYLRTHTHTHINIQYIHINIQLRRKLSACFGTKERKLIKKIKTEPSESKLLIIYFPFHVLPIKLNSVRDKLRYGRPVGGWCIYNIHKPYASRVN